MKVSIIEATSNADRLVCTSARGDYMNRSLVGVDLNNYNDFKEIMEPVEGETLRQKQENLIRKLLKRGHYGPAEHISITFAIEGVSRVCMAQLTRHRHASFDISSMRYNDFSDPEMVTPPSIEDDQVVNREDGLVELDFDDRKGEFNESIEESIKTYRKLVDNGVPKEDARFVLPLSTAVDMTMTVNLRTLLHIANLRAKADAQSEIRDLTEMLLDEAEDVAPITMEVWDEMTPMKIAP